VEISFHKRNKIGSQFGGFPPKFLFSRIIKIFFLLNHSCQRGACWHCSGALQKILSGCCPETIHCSVLAIICYFRRQKSPHCPGHYQVMPMVHVMLCYVHMAIQDCLLALTFHTPYSHCRTPFALLPHSISLFLQIILHLILFE